MHILKQRQWNWARKFSTVTFFIMYQCDTPPTYIWSMGLGLTAFFSHVVGGILAPIYYGALIDKTCMKWSVTSCGTRGACRVYNSTLFGWVVIYLINWFCHLTMWIDKWCHLLFLKFSLMCISYFTYKNVCALHVWSASRGHMKSDSLELEL